MQKITTILCPVDGSETARHAFDCALGVARCYGSTLHVLHVIAVPEPDPHFAVAAPVCIPMTDADRERIVSRLRHFLAAEPAPGVPVEYHVAEAPSVPAEILLQTERLGADLVAMGTHGRSGFERFMFGSVAAHVLRRSRAPVLTVPPRAPDIAPVGGHPFRHILYATDFSPGSEAALAYATSFAESAGAHLTLLHVVEQLPVAYTPLPVPTAVETSAQVLSLQKSREAQLHALVAAAVPATCRTDEVVAIGSARGEILRIALERQADLIVLGVHGGNAVDRFVFGSTTEHVLRRAACPVLSVRGGT